VEDEALVGDVDLEFLEEVLAGGEVALLLEEVSAVPHVGASVLLVVGVLLANRTNHNVTPLGLTARSRMRTRMPT